MRKVRNLWSIDRVDIGFQYLKTYFDTHLKKKSHDGPNDIEQTHLSVSYDGCESK